MKLQKRFNNLFFLKESKYLTSLSFFRFFILFYTFSLIYIGYINSPILNNLIFFIIINIFISSLIIVFLPISKQKKILFSTILFLLYLSILRVNLIIKCPYNFNIENVIAIEGHLINDSVQSRTNNRILKVYLQKIYLPSNIRVSSKGIITVIINQNVDFFKSSSLILKGNFEKGIFFAKDYKVISKNIKLGNNDLINTILFQLFENSREVRKYIQKYIYINVPSSLSRLLLLGKTETDSFQFKSAALIVGCSHLLALSGMHLTYISKFFSYIPVKLFNKKLGKRLSLIFPWFFIFIAGPISSLLRAGIMYTFSLFFSSSKEKNEEILLISLFVQLLFFPTSFESVGFVLSYSAIIALNFCNLIFSKLRLFYKFFLPSVFALLVTYPIGKLIGSKWTIASIVVAPLGSALISITMLLSLLYFCIVICISFFNFLNNYFFSLNLLIKIFTIINTFLIKQIYNLEKMIVYLFNWGKKVHLYLPFSLSGYQGYKVFSIILLTIVALYLYSSITLRNRRKKRYELELSIRFPKCNY